MSWEALGKIGATTRTVVDQLVPQMPEQTFDYIVVSSGVNDLISLNRGGVYARDLSQLLERLVQHSPQARIALAGIPPLQCFPLLPEPLRRVFGWRARAFDQVIAGCSRVSPSVVHVPLDFDPSPDMFSADGFHPSAPAYEVFGRGMAAAMLGDKARPWQATG